MLKTIVIRENVTRLLNLVIAACRIDGRSLFAVFLLSLCWPTLLVAKDFQEYVQEASDYFDEGEYEPAVIQLKNALLLKPENAEARLLLGKTYFELDDYSSAQKELTRAQELGISRDRVLVPLARVSILNGESNQVLQTVFVEEGDSILLRIDILLLQGRAFLEEQNPGLADLKFSEVLELEPDVAEALLGKARISYQRRDMATADNLVERALSVDPEYAEAWILKGELLLRTEGKQQEAAAAFQRALEIKPNNGQARLGLATALIARDENRQALAEVDRVLRGYPKSHLAYYIKGLALYQQEKLGSAEEAVTLALNYHPSHLHSHVLAGTIAYQQGKLELAERHLRTYWNQAPGDLRVAVLLGATLLKLGEPAKAIEVLEPGVSAAADDAQYLSLLGSAYLEDGQSAKGIEYLEQAVAVSPDEANLRGQLAMGRLAAGDVNTAISDLKTVVDLDLDQELVQADALLVLTYLHRKEYEKALAATDALLGKMPDSPVPYNFKGAVYLGMGDTRAARNAYEQALKIQPDFLISHFNLAKLDLLANDTAAAEKRYGKVLSYDKDNLKALLGMAVVAHRNGQVDDTEKWLKQAHEYHPKAIGPALLLIEHYDRAGETFRALEMARSTAITHPRNPTLLELMAAIQLKAEENKEAAATLRKLTEVLPESPEAHYRLALVQVRLKQTDAARSGLQRALDLQEDYPEAQVLLGRLDILTKDEKAALAMAEKLQQAHPQAPHGYALEGDVYARREPERAAAAYAMAYEREANVLLARKLFDLRTKTGDNESAYGVLNRWLAEHPEDTATRALLAQALQSDGHKQRATEQYLKLLEHDSGNVAALNNIAWLYQEAGDSRGISYAERAHELAPDRPEVVDTLGWLLVQNGDTNRGLVLLQEAAVKAPHMPEIRYHMAVALAKAGRRDESRKVLDRLLKTGKNFQGVDDARKLREQLGG